MYIIDYLFSMYYVLSILQIYKFIHIHIQKHIHIHIIIYSYIV
jgi:hypothetical protein